MGRLVRLHKNGMLAVTLLLLPLLRMARPGVSMLSDHRRLAIAELASAGRAMSRGAPALAASDSLFLKTDS
jgi:hypothetical protein